MKKLLILSLVMLSAFAGQAQTEKTAPTLEIEVDPVAYILSGYSFHAIYQPGRFRFDAAVFGIMIPESFHGNKGFKVNMNGFGIKAHYLVKGTRGLFAGIGTGYITTNVTLEESGEKQTGGAIGIGPEVGYRIFFQKPVDGRQKGFYLSPWMGLSYNFIPDKINFRNHGYKEQRWTFFPTIHIGYRF